MRHAVVVFSRLAAKPGKRVELLGLLASLAQAAREEPGTECYVLHVARDDPDVVWTYERYTDEAALAAHRDSAAVQAVVPKLGEVLARKPEITFAKPVAEARR